MKVNNRLYILLVIISSLSFSIVLFREIYKKSSFVKKQEVKGLVFSDQEESTNVRKKISSRPFLFGIEKNIVNDEEFYFDDTYFYAINKDSKELKIKLSAIISLSKTSIEINNQRLWEVRALYMEEEIVFVFAHNYTLWNKNFYTFYEKLKRVNPTAIKSKWSLWTM